VNIVEAEPPVGIPRQSQGTREYSEYSGGRASRGHSLAEPGNEGIHPGDYVT